MIFSKPALSIPDQRRLLESRGLVIPDIIRAERYLNDIGYYRLSAYTRPFQISYTTHQFHPNICFDDILNLYIFDRRLRLTLLDALERVEVALRTRVNDIMCSRISNTHWYLDITLFDSRFDHSRLLSEIREYKDDFVTSYKQKYNSPSDVPAWMAVQSLSFGSIQRILLALKKREQKAICDTFYLQANPMITWVYAMSTLRNHCAHHTRTWNRTFHVNLPLIAQLPKHLENNLNMDNYNTLDGYALVLDTFMQGISPTSHWWQRLSGLVQDYYEKTPHDFHKADIQRRAKHLLKPLKTGDVP